MTEQITERTQQTREALFCHTDLDHPLIQVLFNLMLEDEPTDSAD